MVDIANFAARNFLTPSRAEIDRESYGNALLRNDVNRIPQMNRAQDLAIRGAEQNQRAGELEIGESQKTNARGILANSFAAVAQAQDPLIAYQQLINTPDFKAAGSIIGMPVDQFTFDPKVDTADSIRASAMNYARGLGQQLEATPQPFGDPYGGPGGSLLQRAPTGEVRSVVGREPSQPASAQSEPLESVLGPDGKPILVPRSQASGMQPYQKPTGGLSPRDATTARNKLTQIGLARQQIALARENFRKIQNTFSAGAGGGYLPTQAGQAFDRAVDSMRGTITGIMRVPGVGAMSDYETRLDQAKMPSRGQYENTTVQQLDSLDQMLNQLEQGYAGILEGGGVEQAAPAQPAAPRRVRVDAEGNVIGN